MPSWFTLPATRQDKNPQIGVQGLMKDLFKMLGAGEAMLITLHARRLLREKYPVDPTLPFQVDVGKIRTMVSRVPSLSPW